MALAEQACGQADGPFAGRADGLAKGQRAGQDDTLARAEAFHRPPAGPFRLVLEVSCNVALAGLLCLALAGVSLAAEPQDASRTAGQAVSQAVSLAARPQAPRPGETWREPATGMEFVSVPGGCFMMGCGSWQEDCEIYEAPSHKVCLSAFWIGRTEVTQEQWAKVTGENPAVRRGPNLPVEAVTWRQAVDFAAKLSAASGQRLRLPTEAEWEYAARSGGKRQAYAGGDNPDALGWHLENSREQTHPVAQKRPNGLGLYDMTGNVAEWCQDTFDRDFYAKSPEQDPRCDSPGQTPADRRVRRGGTFQFVAREARTAARGKLEPDSRDEYTGLRLVREAE